MALRTVRHCQGLRRMRLCMVFHTDTVETDRFALDETRRPAFFGNHAKSKHNCNSDNPSWRHRPDNQLLEIGTVAQHPTECKQVEDYPEPNSSQTPDQFVDAAAECEDDQHQCDQYNGLHLGVDGFVCVHFLLHSRCVCTSWIRCLCALSALPVDSLAQSGILYRSTAPGSRTISRAKR